MTLRNSPMVPRPSEVMAWPFPPSRIFSVLGTKSVSSGVGGDMVEEQAESRYCGGTAGAAFFSSSKAMLQYSHSTPSPSNSSNSSHWLAVSPGQLAAMWPNFRQMKQRRWFSGVVGLVVDAAGVALGLDTEAAAATARGFTTFLITALAVFTSLAVFLSWLRSFCLLGATSAIIATSGSAVSRLWGFFSVLPAARSFSRSFFCIDENVPLLACTLRSSTVLTSLLMSFFSRPSMKRRSVRLAVRV